MSAWYATVDRCSDSMLRRMVADPDDLQHGAAVTELARRDARMAEQRAARIRRTVITEAVPA